MDRECALKVQLPPAPVITVEEIIFAYCIDPYHETAADDDVMTAHQIFYIIGISEQSYKCCHEEQCIQECGKESG